MSGTSMGQHNMHGTSVGQCGTSMGQHVASVWGDMMQVAPAWGNMMSGISMGHEDVWHQYGQHNASGTSMGQHDVSGTSMGNMI